jgi:hypothetical protein
MRAALNDKAADQNTVHAKLMVAVTDSSSPYICYLASEPVRAKMLADYEQSRQDKQPGASSNSSGTTSVVSKGSTPSLLGFAIEYGGLTQTTSGTTITFRGNVANSISALLKSSYLGSYQLSQRDPLVRFLTKFSFGVSFDTKANQPSTTQGFEPSGKNFSGFSAKYEIYNHRDPRHKEFKSRWDSLAGKQGMDLALSVGQLRSAMESRRTDFQRWKGSASADIDKLTSTSTDPDLLAVLEKSADLFKSSFFTVPEIQSALSEATTRMTNYVDQQNQIIADIRKSPIATLEYNLTRQLTSNDKTIMATQPNQKIPDLSNLNFVLEGWFGRGPDVPELTLNAGGTWFNSPNTADPKRGRVRDIRASLEADWQLTALTKLNKPTLSLSGGNISIFLQSLWARW